jgi:thiol-disulfide isomerase/thioredoxin
LYFIGSAIEKGLVCNMILQRLIGSVVLLGVLIGVITPIFTGCTAASNATAENPATAVTPSAPAVDVVDSKTKTAAYPLLSGSDMMTVIAPEAVLDILPQTAKKPLILDFTSEYCSECRALAPVLAAAEKRYAAKLTFMPIDVQKMMDAKDDTLQGKRLLLAMRPLYTPTLVAIAPGGIIVGVETGFKTSTQLDTLFNKVLPPAMGR